MVMLSTVLEGLTTAAKLSCAGSLVVMMPAARSEVKRDAFEDDAFNEAS